MKSKQNANRANNMHKANRARTEKAAAKLIKKRRLEGLTSAESARLADMINRLI